MKFPRSSLLAPLILAGAVITPNAVLAQPVVAAASPKSLGLTLQDVQKAYGPTFRAFITNAYKASKITTCGENYSGGYLAMFANVAHGRKSVIASVSSAVFAYVDARSFNCAMANHGFLDARAKSLRAHGISIHTVPLHGVGDHAWVTTSSAPAQHAYTVSVSLFRGTDSATVTVTAVGGAPTMATVVALAKSVDGRIQAAG